MIMQQSEKLPEYTLPGSGKLLITKELEDQIDYLHSKVGAFEWIGILFYRHISGEINKSENFALQAEHIYPMNIGTETFTAEDILGLDLVDMYEKVPDAENIQQGIIHTHHNMKVWFSSVDMDELQKNSPLHNYYLSLIVGFDGKYMAKISYVADLQHKFTFTGADDTLKTMQDVGKKVLILMDLEVTRPTMPLQIPEYLQQRYEILNKKWEEERKKKVAGTSQNNNYIGFQKNWPQHDNLLPPKQHELPFGNKRNAKRNSQKAIKKAGAISRLQNTSGKLTNPQGKYISIQEIELRDLLIDWLNSGLDSNADMFPPSKFNAIYNGLDFFDSYFEKSEETYDLFLTNMKANALLVFKDYSLRLISARGCAILESYLENYSTALDLYNILATFDGHSATYSNFDSPSQKRSIRHTGIS